MIQTDRARIAKIETIQAGAAAGHHGLPERFVEALRTHQTVRTQLTEARQRQAAVVGPDGFVSTMAESILDAARSGAR